MTLTERTTIVGTVLGLVTFLAYWTVVITRALTDDLPLQEVAWQGPMLWSLIIGGGLYAVAYLVFWLRARGEPTMDVRDAEIQRYAESVGGGLTGLGVLAALIMLALNVDTFWVANVLFTVAFLGSLVSSATTIASYREGLPS